MLQLLTELATQIKNIATKVAKIANWIGGITYEKGTGYYTSSTSWFYTGVKITIPANCIFGINADFVYSYNAPRGGAFASRSDNVNYIWQEGVGTTYGVVISCVDVTTSVREIYLWAKYAGASSNYVNYTYWYIPFPNLGGGSEKAS